MRAMAWRTPRRFDVRQGIGEAPLTHDPETGEPVRRVISGGLAPLTSKEARRGEQSLPTMGGCCGGSCGH